MNDLAPLHGNGDIHQVYRMETYPASGWMMLKAYYEEAIRNWLVTDKVNTRVFDTSGKSNYFFESYGKIFIYHFF